MKPHEYEFGDRPWPDGKGVLQVYAPIDLTINPEAAALVDKIRDAMDGAPVSMLDTPGLHVTLDLVADKVIEDLTQSERDDLEDALRSRLADMPVYHGFAYPIAYAVGPIMDISPAGPLRTLQQAARDTIRSARGDTACTFRQAKPHMSLGYCHTPTDTDPWSRKVRQIDPAVVPLTITTVELVDVRPDNVTKELGWKPIAPSIPLRAD
ncbi:hypothetical protein [Amycolatopsis sp. RTGN1]|uniref:hypothetical protein n=1 Tax=Amycolatopsis ponsaeliensis TaxID=2992142 RepID=UPI002551253E|nr:hypothetical protein [Amycolatopsis sp. RTGN1]